MPGDGVADPLLARHQAALEEVRQLRMEVAAVGGDHGLVDQGRLATGSRDRQGAPGQELEEDRSEGVDIVCLRRRSARQDLRSEIAACGLLDQGMVRRVTQAGRGLETEQAQLAFVGDDHQMGGEEAVLDALVADASFIGHRESEGDALGHQQGVIERNGRVLARCLLEKLRQRLAGDVVVGDIGNATHLPEVEPEAEIRTLQRLLQRCARLDALRELLAIEALAVEDAQQKDPLDSLLAEFSGAEGLAQRVLGELLEEKVVTELVACVHSAPWARRHGTRERRDAEDPVIDDLLWAIPQRIAGTVNVEDRVPAPDRCRA